MTAKYFFKPVFSRPFRGGNQTMFTQADHRVQNRTAEFALLNLVASLPLQGENSSSCASNSPCQFFIRSDVCRRRNDHCGASKKQKRKENKQILGTLHRLSSSRNANNFIRSPTYELPDEKMKRRISALPLYLGVFLHVKVTSTVSSEYVPVKPKSYSHV